MYLQAKVKEVGTRNQVLYKMLSKGECMLMNIDSCTLYCISFIVATKAELLEQVEELSSVKDEMTKEVICF